MSGGSYDYLYHKLDDMADEIGSRSACTPLRRAFVDHLRLVAKACHAIEWVDSGDWGDGDEDEHIRRVISEGAALPVVVRQAEEAIARMMTELRRTAAPGGRDE